MKNDKQKIIITCTAENGYIKSHIQVEAKQIDAHAMLEHLGRQMDIAVAECGKGKFAPESFSILHR